MLCLQSGRQYSNDMTAGIRRQFVAQNEKKTILNLLHIEHCLLLQGAGEVRNKVT